MHYFYIRTVTGLNKNSSYILFIKYESVYTHSHLVDLLYNIELKNQCALFKKKLW